MLPTLEVGAFKRTPVHTFGMMTLEVLVRAGFTIALLGVMVAQGMQVEREHLGFLLRHPAQFLRSALAVLVIVPLIALLMVAVFRPQPEVAIGLILLAASPINPISLGKIARSGGDVVLARALHFALALLAVGTTPLVLKGMSAALGLQLSISPGSIARQVTLALLAPMIIGAVLNRVLPKVSRRVRDPLGRICLLVLVATFALVLAVEIEAFGRIAARGYLAMSGLVVLSLVGGHYVAGGSAETRTTVALESALRNPGLAAFIAVFNLPSARPVALLIPYLVISIVLTSVYAKVRGRGRSGKGVRSGARRRTA